jgi:hypothetical protein
MSGLADALAKHAEMKPPGPLCTVCALLHDVDAEDRLVLEKALADPIAFSSRALELAVAESYERQIAAFTWQRHRTGRCASSRYQ